MVWETLVYNSRVDEKFFVSGHWVWGETQRYVEVLTKAMGPPVKDGGS